LVRAGYRWPASAGAMMEYVFVLWLPLYQRDRPFSVEHDEIINATGLLVRGAGRGDHAGAAEAAGVLVDLLDSHTGAEERSLFAELRLDPEFTEHIDSLCAEHFDIHALLGAIAGGDLELEGVPEPDPPAHRP
jgi:hypothetical protein